MTYKDIYKAVVHDWSWTTAFYVYIIVKLLIGCGLQAQRIG